MQTVIAVAKDLIGYFDPRTKKGLIRIVVLLVIVFISTKLVSSMNSSSEEEVSVSVPLVHVASVIDLSGDSLFELVGSVEAISSANITAEASGRVTVVNVELGQQIGAGTVIAQIENSSQYASLLQAEGAYEAAVAAAASSDVGVTNAETALLSAKNNAISANQSAYNTVTSIVLNDVDVIFSDPRDVTPGVGISGANQTKYLNTTRYELNETFENWRVQTNTLSPSQDVEAVTEQSIVTTEQVLNMIDVIIERLSRDEDEYEDTEFSGLRTTLIADRTSINSVLASLRNSQTAMTQASDSLTQAQISGTGSDLSAANAQVKQALGSLRAAQANYNKTIFTTPISGVVNVLDVKVGDFVGMQQAVASIANNDALEITVFVGERDASLLSLGQTVVIDNEYEGTVTNIAPAINPTTKKIEVKIQTESDQISNGDTVTVALTRNEEPTDDNAPLSVPLTAVKFTATDGSVFVVEDNKLVAKPVTLGTVSGSSVVIESGLERNEVIVIDARGLSAGQEVEALTK